jgi:hypothetical protein
MIFVLLGYLSVLLPDPSVRGEKWISQGDVSLPYGFLPLFEDSNKIDISLYSVVDTVNYVQFCPTLKYRFDKWGGEVAPYGRLGGDHFYPRRKKFGVYADFIRGSIYYKNDNILFSFGKDVFSIGPAFYDNPLLSPNIPLNYLTFTFKNSKFAFTHFISRLGNYEGVEYEWDDTSSGYLTNANRYLGVHRLEIKLADWLAISFSESMLIGGESLGFPFELLAPLTVYYVEQHNKRRNTNILWNFDLVAVRGKFLFYFDFFIDDFQYEADPWKEPNHIGLYAGIQGKDLLGANGSQALISYTLMTRWVYDNIRVWQRYLDNEMPIGSRLGCDYDRFVLVYLYPVTSFKLGGKASYTRRGENKITAPWPVDTRVGPSSENEFTGGNFLSGTVEKRLTLAAVVKYKCFLELTGGLSYFRNYEHQQGTTKTLPIIELKLKYSI